jgi:hypothetical protein
MCIAAGVPFFGIPVTRGRVLYLDFEDTIEDAVATPERIAHHLGLRRVPKNFKLWHPAMAVDGYDENHIWDIIRDSHPTLVILDTLSASFPKAEKDNTEAGTFINTCRSVCREVGCSIMFTHHLKKSSGRGGDNNGPPLAEPTIQELMKDTRGAIGLINGANVRLMFQKPRSGVDGPCAFEIHGFRRMFGTLPMIPVERVFDNETQDAIGYDRLAGVELIHNPKYREIFRKLPREFQRKDLREFLSGSSTQLCIGQYIAAGVIDPPEAGCPFRKKDGV